MNRRLLLQALAGATLIPGATLHAAIGATPGERVGQARLLWNRSKPNALHLGQVLTLRREPVEMYNTHGVAACVDGDKRGVGFFGVAIADRLDAGECLVAQVESAELVIPAIDCWRFHVGVYRVPPA